jgi:alkanesulfonate monooxygenase SsuD/methylene tetrahydromethanopterin reductase-like flavin-dependent oxidoreductase (luciferase family)
MKASFLATTTYAGPAPGLGAWPVPPSHCDRDVASRTMKVTLETCRLAEELGFDWISLSEHHYAPLMLTPNPLVMAGALSQVVKRCRIALLGPLLPLANPVRVAEEIAMLDQISDGRVTVLFLRGTPNEHHTYGDVSAQSRAMTQEGVDLILRAWTSDEPFSWEGQHFQFKTVSVWPRTLQTPHPQVFGSGNSDESVVFAAKRGLGIGMSFAGPKLLKRWIDLYREEAEKAGWTPTAEHVLYRGNAHVAVSDEQAHRDAARGQLSDAEVSAQFKVGAPDPDNPLAYITRPYFLGSPATVLEQIAVLRDLGVGVIDMAFATGIGDFNHERQVHAMELFAGGVLPEIRGW